MNLGTDQRTRVMLFATNLDPRTTPLSVAAVNTKGTTYQLPIEFVGNSPGMDGVTTLIVILPQDTTLHGDLFVTLTAAGVQSNSIHFAIR